MMAKCGVVSWATSGTERGLSENIDAIRIHSTRGGVNSHINALGRDKCEVRRKRREKPPGNSLTIF